jgi:hypothetical protein
MGTLEQYGGGLILVGTSLGTDEWVRVPIGLPDLVIGFGQNGS